MSNASFTILSKSASNALVASSKVKIQGSYKIDIAMELSASVHQTTEFCASPTKVSNQLQLRVPKYINNSYDHPDERII
jgi:hypothetical protein